MKRSNTRGKQILKAKRVSKIAKGRMQRAQVMRGCEERMSSGPTMHQLTKSKRGKIISKKAQPVRKKLYDKSIIKIWAECVSAARKALNLQYIHCCKGFCGHNRNAGRGQGFIRHL